jgi:hypothetical protein
MRRGHAAGCLLAAGLLAMAGCSDPSGSVPVGAVLIELQGATLAVGDTLRVDVVTTDLSGTPMEGARLRWASDAPAVATVEDGFLTALAPGSARITASAGSVSDMLRVTVTAMGGVGGPPPRYLVVDLGSLPDSSGRSAAVIPGLTPASLNDLGLVAFASDYAYPRSSRVGIWRDGVATPVPGFLAGYTWSNSQALNDLGQVAGIDPRGRAFVVTAGRVEPLDTLALRGVYRVAIGDGGMVVGELRPGGLGDRATSFVRHEGRTILPLFPGASSRAVAVNSRNEVAGDADGKAFLWQAGKTTALGIVEWKLGADRFLDGAPKYEAADITDNGEVIGNSLGMECAQNFGGCWSAWRAFVWRNGRNTVLPPLAGYANTRAIAGNNRGEVVGESANLGPNGSSAVTLWRGGVAYPLAPALAGSGWILGGVLGINDRGEITALGARTVGAGWYGLLLVPQ